MVTGQTQPVTDDPVSRAYADGYRDGYQTGWDVGYAHAEHAMATAWARLAQRIRRMANTPTHADLVDRRRAVPDQPCPDRACAGCSTCTRAAAVARYGGDYPGQTRRPGPPR